MICIQNVSSSNLSPVVGDPEVWGHAVVQSVELMRYKPGGRGFHCHSCSLPFPHSLL